MGIQNFFLVLILDISKTSLKFFPFRTNFIYDFYFLNYCAIIFKILFKNHILNEDNSDIFVINWLIYPNFYLKVIPKKIIIRQKKKEKERSHWNSISYSPKEAKGIFLRTQVMIKRAFEIKRRRFMSFLVPTNLSLAVSISRS